MNVKTLTLNGKDLASNPIGSQGIFPCPWCYFYFCALCLNVFDSIVDIYYFQNIGYHFKDYFGTFYIIVALVLTQWIAFQGTCQPPDDLYYKPPLLSEHTLCLSHLTGNHLHLSLFCNNSIPSSLESVKR